MESPSQPGVDVLLTLKDDDWQGFHRQQEAVDRGMAVLYNNPNDWSDLWNEI